MISYIKNLACITIEKTAKAEEVICYKESSILHLKKEIDNSSLPSLVLVIGTNPADEEFEGIVLSRKSKEQEEYDFGEMTFTLDVKDYELFHGKITLECGVER